MLCLRRRGFLSLVLLGLTMVGASCSSPDGNDCADGRCAGTHGTSNNETNNGSSNNGSTSNNASSTHGASNNDGTSNNGASNNGLSNNGVSNNGTSNNGTVPSCPEPARRMCADACVACPDGAGVLTTGCEEGACVVTACQPGLRLCGGGCCADPTTGVLESDGITGVFPNMALDALGNPHIGYYDATNKELKYAFWDGMSWNFEVVVAAGAEEETDIELDARGNPYIAWYDPDARAVRLASRIDGAAWTVATVASLDDERSPGGPYVSLAIDPAGYPHVAYHVRANQTLRYARWDGVAWQDELVPDTEMAGMHVSLAIDSAGHPHISYAESFHHLRYAYHDGAQWQIGAVDVETIAEGTTIALDAQNRPHIAFYDLRTQQLKHTHYDGAQWVTTSLDNAQFTGVHSSLALDASGQPHITYAVHTDGMRYAYRDATGTWHLARTVDPGAMMGTSSSIAIHPTTGLPHVAYYDGTAWDLKYLIISP